MTMYTPVNVTVIVASNGAGNSRLPSGDNDEQGTLYAYIMHAQSVLSTIGL